MQTSYSKYQPKIYEKYILTNLNLSREYKESLTFKTQLMLADTT